jgi:hypothetical protein
MKDIKNKKAKKEKLGLKMARGILSGTVSATAWIFETLIFMGALTIEAFLNPSYYADLPATGFGFEKDLPKKKKPAFEEVTIRQSIGRLQKLGFVEKIGGKYTLSEKGKKLADYILARKKNLESKWDGKYRVVIFDIPEKQSHVRDWLRRELYMLDYKKLQKSVFIGKQPLPKDLIQDIKRQKIGNFVNYLLVEKTYKNLF